MITTYSRGNVTLTIDQPHNASHVTFTLTRHAPLAADDIRRVNNELADHPAAHGAQLTQSPGGTWEIRTPHTIFTTDQGNPTSPLQWRSPPG